MVKLVAMTLAVALAAGCASNAGPQTAARRTSVEGRAVIQEVDPATRQVVMRLEDGAIFETTAGPEVRNFDQLEPGDTVLAVFEEQVSLRLATEEDFDETVGAVMSRRAEEGEAPGAVVATAVSTVVTVVAYDPTSGVATFTTPEGETLSRVVAPEMREFAAARSPGDRVFVEMSDLIALGIEETAQ